MKRYQVTVEEIVDKPASIPLQPAEAVTMTEGAALEYLKSGPDYQRAVIDRDGDVWTYGNGKVVLHGSEAGSTIMLGAPFTPLLTATRTQVELEKQLTVTRESLDAAVVELEQVRRERDAALGSQKAAVAALEVERAENKRLVNKVNALALVFDRTKRAIQVYEMAPVATAGKESG